MPEETNNSLLQLAYDKLAQNLDKDISLTELADELQIGYESFRKKFKQEFGISPNQFRINKKMEQACILLDNGIPIKEIARMVGYEDTFSFSKQFTKLMKVSPGRYRKD